MTPLTIALLAVAAIAVVGGLGAIALYALSAVAPSRPTGNVTAQLEGCSQDSGFYRTTITVHNGTTHSRTVFVDIEWLDSAGTRLAKSTEIVDSVNAGHTAKKEALAVGPDSGTPTRCTYRLR